MLYLTPVFHAFHDGGYDAFDAASPGVEAIADEGDVPAGLAATTGLSTGVVAGPASFRSAPVIDPGETATLAVDVDPAPGRSFGFLSMMTPPMTISWATTTPRPSTPRAPSPRSARSSCSTATPGTPAVASELVV